MGPEQTSLIRELCYIAHKRNELNHKRTQALWRKSYWQKAIKVVEAFKQDSHELRKLDKKIERQRKDFDVSLLEKRKNEISINMHYIRQVWLNSHKSLPKKWMTMGPMKLRALVLKSEAEYAQAKYDTMVLSEKTTNRVKQILKQLNCFIDYNNGYVTAITPYRYIIGHFTVPIINGKASIAEYAKEYELHKAIDDMLRS